MRNRKGSTAMLGLVVAAMATVAACGGPSTSSSSSAAADTSSAPAASSEPASPASESPKTMRPVTVLLDWYPNPDQVSLYLAKEKGFFADVGLDVTLQAPSDPSDPPKLVSTGNVELGISYQPEMYFSTQAGLKIKAVASLIPTALNSVMWLESSGLKSLSELNGKTIGMPGFATDTAFLSTIFAAYNIDPGSVNVVTVKTSLMQALLSGKADAVIGAYGNIEGVKLAEDGFNPTITRVSDAGVPNYDELVLIANSDRLASDADYQAIVRDFLAALAKATAAAIADPAMSTAVMTAVVADVAGPTLNAQVAATLSLLSNPKGFGQMDAANWDSFGKFMVDQKLVDAVSPATDLMTNEFLPAS